MLRLLLLISVATFGVGIYGAFFVGDTEHVAEVENSPLSAVLRTSNLPKRSNVKTPPPDMAQVAQPIARPKSITAPEPPVANISRSATDDTPAIIGTRVYVKGTTVNLRSAPNVDAPVMDIYPIGTMLTFTGDISGEWKKINLLDGRFGWMYGEFLSELPPN